MAPIHAALTRCWSRHLPPHPVIVGEAWTLLPAFKKWEQLNLRKLGNLSRAPNSLNRGGARTPPRASPTYNPWAYTTTTILRFCLWCSQDLTRVLANWIMEFIDCSSTRLGAPWGQTLCHFFQHFPFWAQDLLCQRHCHGFGGINLCLLNEESQPSWNQVKSQSSALANMGWAWSSYSANLWTESTLLTRALIN